MKIINVGGNSIPTGLISLWSGLLVNIPTGWGLCDGEDGRPDLRSKFIMGSPDGDDPGDEGGETEHEHTEHAALSHADCAVAQHAALSHSGGAVAQHAAKNSAQCTATTNRALDGSSVATANHYHVISAYSHDVTQPSQHAARSHVVTQPSQHAAQSHNAVSNNPVYYTLAFIIKE